MTFEDLLGRKAYFIKGYIKSLDDEEFAALLEYAHDLDLDGKNIEEFNKVLLDNKIQNRLKLLDRPLIIKYLSISVINVLLNNNYFKRPFLTLDIERINELVEEGLIIPFIYTNDKDFISKYLEVVGVQKKRFYINNLIKNNYSIYEVMNQKLYELDDEEIDNSLKEFEKLLKAIDVEKITPIFSKKIFELLVDRYFGDFVYNIKVNMKMIVDFISKINDKIISDERLYWYDLLLNFENESLERQIEIYHIVPEDISEWLYEDFRTCQNYAYNLINQNILDLSILDKENKDDVTIYKLNGEDFLLPVHATEYSKDDNDFKWDQNSDIKTLSISLIGSKCLGLFRNPKECIIVGFNKLNSNDIMHMYHADSYSDREYSTKKINELCMPLELLSKTYGYNEILIAQNILNNEKLIPNYLVCYDEVTDNEIKLAKKLTVPIILIMTKYYESYDMPYIDYNDDYYVTNLNSLFMKEIGEKQKIKNAKKF